MYTSCTQTKLKLNNYNYNNEYMHEHIVIDSGKDGGQANWTSH